MKLSSLIKDPFEQFELWYNEKLNSSFTGDPTAMVLATVGINNRVSLRMVLMKAYDKSGFVFYTNYYSKKGLQIKANPYGALLFYWEELGYQIRIEGKIEKIPEEESDKYFKTRPYISKLGAHASLQSVILSSRHKLIIKVLNMAKLYPIKDTVPRPEYWGGYKLVPDMFEFWHKGPFRLHDRFLYIFFDNKWIINRLYP